MTQSTVGIILAVLLVLVRVAAAADTLTIMARQAVVRAGPDSKQAILTTAAQGTPFALLEARKGWYKIVLDDGREGWLTQAAAQVQREQGSGVVAAGAATASPRRALVIGNAAYAPDIGLLHNPVNDAADMAASLHQLGFTVTLVRDADKQRLVEAVETFGRQLGPQDVGLFYFAGHGAEGADGHNYLIPLGARVARPVDIQFQGVAADWVLAHMEEAREGAVNLVILDACRNAPFRSLWRAVPSGLVPMYGAGGALIAYATAPGKLAAEGRGQRNGIYTKHLLRFLREPNLPVEQMFKQVRLAVEQETRGQESGTQTPWESSSLRVEFAFHPQPATAPSGPGIAPSRPTPPSPAGATPVGLGVYPQPPAASQPLRNSSGMEFVLIPAGEFQMGANDGDNDEQPVHTVRLSQPFYLGKYEVTQAQWEAVMGNNPSQFTGDPSRPVEHVSWEDVQEFIRRLHARDGGPTYRLPTEAEWEYAARAGSTTAYSFGESASQLGQYGWYGDSAGGTTHPVGRLLPNAWGLYDMHGNVWEWVQDWKGEYPSGAVTDPAGPRSGSRRVDRGGGWRYHARYSRSAARSLDTPGLRSDFLGFRLLREVP